MSDLEAPVHARLAALQARLGQSTPPALEGQQTIPIGAEDADGSEDVTQPSLW